MNILYLTTHLNIGGITSYVLSLASGLKAKGHKVYVASSGGEVLPRFIQEGIINIAIPIKTKSEISPKVFISLFKLLEIIKVKNIDVIHSHTRVTQVLGCLIHKFSSKPHIWTCHGFFKKRLSRKIFPCWGNKVIAISDSVKEHLLEDFGVKEEKIRVIYSGIDIEKSQIPNLKSQTEMRKKLGLGEGPVVGIMARLSQEKGHLYLIQAIHGIIQEFPQVQLLIVGEGKMQQRLLDLTKDLGLGDKVFFLPSAIDTQEIFSVMDIFVLPSLKEGLGLSLMEAMARGLAVIGSDVGGIKNLIQDKENGLLVSPADTKQLSEAILALLQDSARREYLGNHARIFIKQNFSLDKMLQATEKLYLECLETSY